MGRKRVYNFEMCPTFRSTLRNYHNSFIYLYVNHPIIFMCVER